MKNTNWYFCLLLGILSWACQNQGDTEAGTSTKGEEKVNPAAVVETVNQYVSSVQDQRDDLQKRGPLTITRGDSILEVTVFVEGGDPKLIFAQGANMDYQGYYFLENRQLVQLEELGQDEKFYHRKFYYEKDKLVEALEKEANEREKLTNRRFKSVMKRRYPEAFGFRAIEAYTSAMNLLMGR